jgi:hypothetical protein
MLITVCIVILYLGIPIKTIENTTNGIVMPIWVESNSVCGKTIAFASKSELIIDGVVYTQIEMNKANISKDFDLSKFKFRETKVTYHENLVTGSCYKSDVFIDRIEEVK